MAEDLPPRLNPYRIFQGAFIPNAVLSLPTRRLSSDAKVCYARLLRFAGKKGVAYPYKRTLAAEIGVSFRGVGRALRELCDLKLISIKKRGPGRPALTFFHFPPEIFGPVDNSKNMPPVARQRGENVPPVARQRRAAPIDRARGDSEVSHTHEVGHRSAGGRAARGGPVFSNKGNPEGQRRVGQLLAGIVNAKRIT